MGLWVFFTRPYILGKAGLYCTGATNTQSRCGKPYGSKLLSGYAGG